MVKNVLKILSDWTWDNHMLQDQNLQNTNPGVVKQHSL